MGDNILQAELHVKPGRRNDDNGGGAARRDGNGEEAEP
jgi:hypothetical protein